MNIDEYRQLLLKPISDDAPVGVKIVDDPAYDLIETQMMKVGSLNHNEIDWSQIEKEALNLLVTKTKDFKVLGYLIQCLQYLSNPERFTLSLNILSDFVKTYYLTAHPFAGERGAIGRKRLYIQILQRSTRSLAQMDLTTFDSTDKDAFTKAVDELSEVSNGLDLADEALDSLVSAVRRLSTTEARAEIAATNKAAGAATSITTTTGSSTGAQASNTPVLTTVNLDGSNERAAKKSFLQIADFLDQYGEIDLSLKMRRLSVWLFINSPPAHNENNETELSPVSADRIAEYQDRVMKDPDMAVWKKIEQSLTVTPYWLDGHYLSYQMAKKIGLSKTAVLIKESVLTLSERLPFLKVLKFKGNIPFMSPRTLAWLEEEDKSAVNAGSSDVIDHKAAALQMIEETSLSEGLKYLNQGLESAKELRSQFYWRLALAEVLEAQGLEKIALEEYKVLSQILTHSTVPDWESSLVHKISSKINI